MAEKTVDYDYALEAGERDPKELAARYLAFYNIVYPDMGPDHAFELTRELLRAERALPEKKQTPKLPKEEIEEIRKSYVVFPDEVLDNWDKRLLYGAINGRTTLIHWLLDQIEPKDS